MSNQMKERHKTAEREDNPLLKELNSILGNLGNFFKCKFNIMSTFLFTTKIRTIPYIKNKNDGIERWPQKSLG